MKTKSLGISKLCGKLTEYGSFLLFAHVRPDADTLGSAFALKEVLNRIGKRAEIVCGDKIPERLLFLTRTDDLSIQRLTDYTPDCIVTVDVASCSLLGCYEEYGKKADIMIDHHIKREVFAKYYHIKPTASACGEIIYDVARYFEKEGLFKIDEKTASYLFSAISSDTGGFIFSNTTPRTMKIGADLLSRGIKGAEINELLHKRTPKNQLKAQGEIVSNMRFYENDKIAGVYFDFETKRKLGINEDDIGDIVNVARYIPTVLLAFSAKQETENKFKISFRSPCVDVSALASQFGGGGHLRASGCTVYADDIEMCLKTVSDACKKALENTEEIREFYI